MMLLDTWAWIEYFKGTDKGQQIKDIIANNPVHTSAISIAEISKWFYQNKADINPAIKQIKQNSLIIEIEESILIESGKKYVELRQIKKDIGLIDIIIYTTALFYNLKLISNDSDLKDLPMWNQYNKGNL